MIEVIKAVQNEEEPQYDMTPYEQCRHMMYDEMEPYGYLFSPLHLPAFYQYHYTILPELGKKCNS